MFTVVLFPGVISDPLGSLGTLGTRLTGSLSLLRRPDLLFGDPRQAAQSTSEPACLIYCQLSFLVLWCRLVLTSLGLSFSICKMGLYLPAIIKCLVMV